MRRNVLTLNTSNTPLPLEKNGGKDANFREVAGFEGGC